MSSERTSLRRERIASIAIAIAIALIGAWAFTGLEVRHDITGFVPSTSEDAALARIARDVIDSELSRTIVIAVGATISTIQYMPRQK